MVLLRYSFKLELKRHRFKRQVVLVSKSDVDRL